MEEKNYIKEYYAQQEHDLTSLLSCKELDEEKIREIKRQISQLQKQIDEKGNEIHKILDKAYSKHFEPTSKKICIKYRSNKNRINYYFDFDSGLVIDEVIDDEYESYFVDTKSGEIELVVGYNYELASIIIKKYKYTISRDNDKITTKLLKESVIDFLGHQIATKDIETNNIFIDDTISWEHRKALSNITNSEFINKLYSTNYNGKLSLDNLFSYNKNNICFEIIIKNAPKEIIDDLLKLNNLESVVPIHKIIGISLETYNQAVERGIIKKVFDNREFISGKNNEKYGINKTEKEWLDFIEEIKTYEEDLKFYNIDFSSNYYYNDNGLFETLLESYKERNILKDYYSLGKFVGYVINETINQGYNRVRDFINELVDYLEMCKHDNIKPTLYSSYLKQTHDITSRNHRVIVEQEKEEMFKNRYKDFKEYKGKEYYVIAPKDSNDLKKEGDRLNHCVASYIKRVIDGECLIFFLRREKDESLITIEVRHNTICQVRGLHNRKPTDKEVQAIKDFAKCREIEVNF